MDFVYFDYVPRFTLLLMASASPYCLPHDFAA